MYDNNGDIIGLCGIARDITEKKHADEEIKKSLKEKEVLLQEIHHRVKNNMQIISSLLNLQKYYLDDDMAINVIKESQNRVKSMALLHEKLYQSPNLTRINFYDYTKSQISDLSYSYAVDQSKITFVIEIEEITLNIETALPIGLIISEIVSNSIKYAFPNNIKGEIFIGLKLSDDGEFELRVRDNGIGLPEGMELNNLDSLGLKLVTNLVNQIDGKIEIDSINGVDFKIKFRELKYEKRI
jgi:two-component sensor histidine kinase